MSGADHDAFPQRHSLRPSSLPWYTHAHHTRVCAPDMTAVPQTSNAGVKTRHAKETSLTRRDLHRGVQHEVRPRQGVSPTFTPGLTADAAGFDS